MRGGKRGGEGGNVQNHCRGHSGRREVKGRKIIRNRL